MALDWYDIEKFVDDNEESILIYDDNNYIARVPTLKTTSTFNEIREWRNQTIQIIGLGVTGIIEYYSLYSLKNPKPLNYKARNRVEDMTRWRSRPNSQRSTIRTAASTFALSRGRRGRVGRTALP